LSTTADKSQLALTAEARDHLDVIKEEGGFDDLKDAYLLAVSVALVEGLTPSDTSAGRTTYINIGSLDPENQLRNAVLAVRTDHDDRPVAFIERLAESGIERIHDHLVGKGRSIRDLLTPYAPASETA
jgi:hypothetical protein